MSAFVQSLPGDAAQGAMIAFLSIRILKQKACAAWMLPMFETSTLIIIALKLHFSYCNGPVYLISDLLFLNTLCAFCVLTYIFGLDTLKLGHCHTCYPTFL
jgi:hypothetical protein